MVFIGTKLALVVKYPRQGGGFQPALIHSIESSAASETNTEMVLKSSLVVEQKNPLESKDKMIQTIKEAIHSMDDLLSYVIM